MNVVDEERTLALMTRPRRTLLVHLEEGRGVANVRRIALAMANRTGHGQPTDRAAQRQRHVAHANSVFIAFELGDDCVMRVTNELGVFFSYPVESLNCFFNSNSNSLDFSVSEAGIARFSQISLSSSSSDLAQASANANAYGG